MLAAKDWIKNLNVGDKVIVSSGGAYRNKTIAVVERKTPTGRIVCGGTTFNPDGWERGASDAWYQRRLVESTEDEIQKISDQTVIIKARALAGRVYDKKVQITVEQAQELIKILGGSEG